MLGSLCALDLTASCPGRMFVLGAFAACYFVLPSRGRRWFACTAAGVVDTLMCAAGPAALDWSLLLACCFFLWASHGLTRSNWELA
jgi:hypothetical protein